MILQFQELKVKAINYDGSVVVSGLASTSRLDGDGEQMIITPNALEQALPDFKANGSPVKVEHGYNEQYGDKIVGAVNSLEYLDKDTFNLDNPTPQPTKILGIATIFDPQACQDVLNGVFGAFSIRVRVKTNLGENGKEIPGVLIIPNTNYEILTSIELKELTICRQPKNLDCTFKIVETDKPDILEQYQNKIGQKVKAFDLDTQIVNYATNENGKRFYEVDFVGTKLKSVFIEEDKLKGVTDKGCVMAQYEPAQFKKVTDQIDKNDLHVDPSNALQNGIPKEFHTTLLYGLDPKVTEQQVKEKLFKGGDQWLNNLSLVGTYNTPVLPKVSGTEVFQSPKYDVLVLKMAFEPFNQANKNLRELPHQNDFPDYLPHTTLAYLKKGTGEKYKNIDYSNLDFKIKNIVFSPAGVESAKDYKIIEKAVDGATPATGSGLKQTNYKFYTKVLQRHHEKDLAEKSNDLDEVYKDYQNLTNMGAAEIEAWSKNSASKLASLSRTPISRNIILKTKPKEKWTARDITNANKTIAFISRMKNARQGENLVVDGKDIGISKRDIALKNWGYDPSKQKSTSTQIKPKEAVSSQAITNSKGSTTASMDSQTKTKALITKDRLLRLGNLNTAPISLKKSNMLDKLLQPFVAKITELNPEAKEVLVTNLERGEQDGSDDEVYATVDGTPMIFSITEADGDMVLKPVTDDEPDEDEGKEEAGNSDKSYADKSEEDKPEVKAKDDMPEDTDIEMSKAVTPEKFTKLCSDMEEMKSMLSSMVKKPEMGEETDKSKPETTKQKSEEVTEPEAPKADEPVVTEESPKEEPKEATLEANTEVKEKSYQHYTPEETAKYFPDFI